MTLVSLKPVIGVVNNLMPVALGQTLPIVPKLPDFQAVLGNLLDMLGPTEPSPTLRNIEKTSPDEEMRDEDDRMKESDEDGSRIEAQVLLSERLTAKESAVNPKSESGQDESGEEYEPMRKAWEDTPASSERSAFELESNGRTFAMTSSDDATPADAELADIRSNPALPGMPSDDAPETVESSNGTAIADSADVTDSATMPETEDAPSAGISRSVHGIAKSLRESTASESTTMRSDAAEGTAKEDGRVLSASSSSGQEGSPSWGTADASYVADDATDDASPEPVGIRTAAPTLSSDSTEVSESETTDTQTGIDADPSTMEFSMESDDGETMTDDGTPANDQRPTIGVDLRSEIAMPATAAVTARLVTADQGGLPVEKDGMMPLRGIDAVESKNGSSASAAGVREAAKSQHASSVQDRVEFIDRIVRAARVAQTKGQAQMKIVLQPRNLGNLKVDLTVEEKIVVGTLRTESVQTRDLIVSHLGELKDALQQQGLKVGDFSVSVQQDHSHSPSDRREREEGRRANDGEWSGNDRAAEEPVLTARPRGQRLQVVDVLA